MGKDTRNIYLTNIPLQEAQNQYFSSFDIEEFFRKTEKVKVIDALDRITSAPVFAEKSSPSYNAAAMDGIAVIAEKTYGATESNPIQLKLDKDYIFINTGGCIKEPYDAVIMIEDVVEIDDEKVEIYRGAKPWQHVRPIGEDIVEGEMIISTNHKIRPMDIGGLLAGKIQEVEVYQQPKVGIIPTGSEIIEVSQPLEVGKIVESNSRMFAGMIQHYGGLPNRYPIVKDDYNLIREAICKAVEENDVIIINAGSSAGSKDYTVNILREIGDVVIHGVATKPGKPVILATVKGKPVIGIPGYPVSAYFVFEFFLKPLIFQYNRQVLPEGQKIKAHLTRRVVSSLKHEEYIRLKLGKVGEKMTATPLERGAGVTMSLVKADGILVIPQQSEGYEAGKEIEVTLLKSSEEIQNTIVSIGSHDIVMDIIGNQVHKENPQLFLASAHVGSMGGIMAMKKKECHIAPIHLMDEVTGEYNVSYVKRYLKDEKMTLIKFAKRSQGFMIAKGNPKNIEGIQDLIRDDLQFVNRQRGAGTRILLDYSLKGAGIEASQVNGYDREMTTHMAVAAAVASGTADWGLGVYSAAKSMGLDFIQIGWEDYDLLIRQEDLIKEEIIKLIETMKSNSFIKLVEGLGGYDMKNVGEVLFI
ncbi:molybdopterin biosynthesis protein [Natronincola ferrireducens]|uniref:Molybdopterin molybdenumtransferase n=1 Tax=Natronincola ferrireducens TaxID=393762 RepID=A0A1G9A3X0_9FIRM|nr:molybdopterin biosynthesis protein [Natronincola ferrireducens]SDK21100.1 molybdopterin molybdochelatase [Natronincola ferrireducens]